MSLNYCMCEKTWKKIILTQWKTELKTETNMLSFWLTAQYFTQEWSWFSYLCVPQWSLDAKNINVKINSNILQEIKFTALKIITDVTLQYCINLYFFIMQFSVNANDTKTAIKKNQRAEPTGSTLSYVGRGSQLPNMVVMVEKCYIFSCFSHAEVSQGENQTNQTLKQVLPLASVRGMCVVPPKGKWWMGQPGWKLNPAITV